MKRSAEFLIFLLSLGERATLAVLGMFFIGLVITGMLVNLLCRIALQQLRCLRDFSRTQILADER